jgi:hypothetical protein
LFNLFTYNLHIYFLYSYYITAIKISFIFKLKFVILYNEFVLGFF